MTEHITKRDAEANLVVAREALTRAKSQNKPTKDIKALERHVRNAQAVLNKVNQALRKGK